MFDGFSIGSNDLTQLTLGLDRDSGLVAQLFDERNEAVKSMIRQVIRIAKTQKKKIGICGQGPSDYPDFARFLVKEGIDSISLNPDSVLKTILDIAELETNLGTKPFKNFNTTHVRSQLSGRSISGTVPSLCRAKVWAQISHVVSNSIV